MGLRIIWVLPHFPGQCILIIGTVTGYMRFARDLRMPVPMSLMEERARLTVQINEIALFSDSNGWLQCFIRTTSIRLYFEVNGQGSIILLLNHGHRVNGLRLKSTQYATEII